MPELVETLEKLNKMREQFRKDCEELGNDFFLNFFEKWKKDFPINLETIRWDQFTPYFNDGDECRFGVHMVWVNDMDSYEVKNKLSDLDKELQEKTIKAMCEISNQIYDYQEICQLCFGDHVSVKLSDEGIDVEDCEHE